MNHVEESERSDAFQKLSSNARTVYRLDGTEKFKGDLKQSCLQAALIRLCLCSLITGKEIEIGTYYIGYEGLLPWLRGVEKADSREKTEFSNMDEVFDYIEEQKATFKEYLPAFYDIFTRKMEISSKRQKEGLRNVLESALKKQGKIELKKCRKIFSKEEYHRIWNEKTREKVMFFLKNYEIMRWHIDEVQSAIVDMNSRQVQDNNIDYMLDYVEKNDFLKKEQNYILMGERKFLYDMFRCVEERRLNEPILYNWFFVYLNIKEKIRGELVQSNNWAGFKNFSLYQNRSGLFGSVPFLEKEKARMAVASCFEQNVVKLEIRFSPYFTAERLCKEIRFLDDAIDSKEKFRDHYYYVLHFIKKQDTDGVDDLGCSFRHVKLRQEVRKKALAILSLRVKYPDIASRVLGIDAAAQEIGCRPEVFAQAFRALHEDTRYRDTEKGYQKIPQLRITYHVGEDFLDVIDGLRAIDEAILFLNMDCGDRFGHALALGIEVRKWYESKKYHISLTKQDYLDNVVWLYHAIVRYDIEGQDNLKDWLETEYRKYFEEIYACHMDRNYIEAIQNRMGKKGHKGNISFDIHDYYDAWKLRGDAPELYRKGYYDYQDSYIGHYESHAINKIFPEEFSIRKRSEVAILYHFYHYNAEVRKEGKKKIDKRLDAAYVNCVEKVQKAMQWEIVQRGLAIETNPSSNFAIGTFRRYDEHPIKTFFNKELTFDHKQLENSPQLWVSINTDDQGVFDIKLENEYALIARALEKKKDENGKPVYSKTMIYNWLDEIRKMGLEQSFLVSRRNIYGEE